MLIKALCDYYDILARSGNVLPKGYSIVKTNFLVCLSPEGTIEEIIDWQEKVSTTDAKGQIKEKFFPREVTMPRRTEKPGIESNYIEHRPRYIFGLNFEKGELRADDSKNTARKSHETFRDQNLAFIRDIDSPVVNAYRNFIRNWNPERKTQNDNLLNLGNKYATAGFAFCLSGRPDILLHEDSGIKNAWMKKFQDLAQDSEKSFVAQCCINGSEKKIARIHNKIKGIPGGAMPDKTLVCFKNPSEQSYGNESSHNSNISEDAMEKYSEALNYLLSRREHTKFLDDLVVVFWAMDENEKYENLMSALFFSDEDVLDSRQTEELISFLLSDMRSGNVTAQRIELISNMDLMTDFFVCGLKADSSRISVKFIYRKKFGELLLNAARHKEDMRISEEGRSIPLWRIKKELITPNSTNASADPALMTKILEAVLYGVNYPQGLFSTIVMRVKTDRNINSTRAGIIKACINRRDRLSEKKEEIKVTLDRENKTPAYLCGRLFAILEKLQQDTSNNHLNRTIKDTYFASAASKPAMVFPKLIKLAQFHLNKARNATYYNILLGEVIDSLGGEFPDTLRLVEQGKFMIGYYQQYQSFFVKDKDKDSKENESIEEER